VGGNATGVGGDSSGLGCFNGSFFTCFILTPFTLGGGGAAQVKKNRLQKMILMSIPGKYFH
jgi:hypothetical protein